MVKSIFS